MNDTTETILPQERREAPRENTVREKKIIVVGIGGNGARILQSFRRLPGSAQYDTAAIDTDRESLGLSGAASTIQAEADWTIKSGLGCGGDIMKGERAIARERSRITQLLSAYDFILVTGGLGGGTATGGIRTVASVAKGLSVPAVFLLTTPFSFESYTKRKNAEECIEELLPITEALVVLPNDLLFSTLPPDTPAEEAFARASEEMAASVFGMGEVLRAKNLIGSDFASFSAVLQKRKTSCAIGIGRADADDGLDRCTLALERMLESPFLGGSARLESSNAVILTVTGGPDLRIDEMKRAIESASAILPQGISLTAGTTVNPDYTSQVQLSVLAVRYDQMPETALPPPDKKSDSRWNHPAEKAAAPVRKQPQGDMIQDTFKLETISKGIFSKSAAVKYRDEDLDVPTFQRRGISIDKGSTGKHT